MSHIGTRRRSRMAMLGALALCVALALSHTSAHARPSSAHAAAGTPGSHLRVTEVEYRLLLSRGVIKAGPVSLETIDRGMDPHDVRLRAAASGAQVATPQLTPGQRSDRVVDLKPGVYHLWCTLPEHAKLGMRATLTVVR